jgi:Domain of unknown function (DUF397)
MPGFNALKWRTSSFTVNGANCVEVAMTTEVLVRDSKARQSGHLIIAASSWAKFLNQVQ